MPLGYDGQYLVFKPRFQDTPGTYIYELLIYYADDSEKAYPEDLKFIVQADENYDMIKFAASSVEAQRRLNLKFKSKFMLGLEALGT